MTSARTEELVKYDREHILHAQIPLGETLGVIYDSAEGIVLRDTEGKEYLDASSQMVSCNLGHGRREIIEAAQAQLCKLQHVGQYYGHSSTPMVECAEKLASVTPGDLDHFWFTSGGGEATDAAGRLRGATVRVFPRSYVIPITGLLPTYLGTPAELHVPTQAP